MTEFFSKPLNTFAVGLLIGLGIAVYTWLKGLFRWRQLREDRDELKDHLRRQMAINDKGNQKVLEEAEQLRRENENLRITVATLKAKPGRAELQLLQTYDRAVRLMHQKAPGFGPAWESVMSEAQKELEQTDKGLAAFVRRALRPSTPGGALSEGGNAPTEAAAARPDEEASSAPGKGA